jgi:general secretion pathway protein A
MYNEHFGFQESPFSATPSSRFLYINDRYQEAFANLRYGIEWKKGLIVMTGEVGTGKTTLLGKIMRSLEATIHPVFVSYDHLTYIELLRLISKELGLACDGQDRFATVEQLREYLIAQHKKGHIVALLIDEAQCLSDEMFEDIRFLSNFETEDGKLLQIVLTGQPELETRLNELNLRHIKQRIVVHCRLAPLEDDEVGRYMEVRLQQAGYDGKDLFNADVVSQIALYSGGIPRLINIICDNALLLAYAQSKHKVTTEMIQEVAGDLGLKNRSPIQSATSPKTVETGDDVVGSSSLIGSSDPVESENRLIHHQTSGLARIAGGISLAFVAIGLAGAAFYWSQTTGYFQRAPASKPGSLATHDLADEVSQSMPPTKNISASDGIEEDLRWQPIKVEAITSNPDQPKPKNRQIATKQKESALGNFEVAGPFSFVRGTPRSDARIIATLQPGTQVKVLGKRGDYFRVQTTVDGQTIRGYVHREDAFFERAKNSAQPEAPIQ